MIVNISYPSILHALDAAGHVDFLFHTGRKWVLLPPQLLILIILPLQLLPGGITPRESMPETVKNMMLATPNTHFVSFAQAILYRGAGLETEWPQFRMLSLIGSVFLIAATLLFRKSVANG